MTTYGSSPPSWKWRTSWERLWSLPSRIQSLHHLVCSSSILAEAPEYRRKYMSRARSSWCPHRFSDGEQTSTWRKIGSSQASAWGWSEHFWHQRSRILVSHHPHQSSWLSRLWNFIQLRRSLPSGVSHSLVACLVSSFYTCGIWLSLCLQPWGRESNWGPQSPSIRHQLRQRICLIRGKCYLPN